MCRFLFLFACFSAVMLAAAAKGQGECAERRVPLMRPLPEGSGLHVAEAALRVRVVGHWAAHELEMELVNGGGKECRETVSLTLSDRARALGFAVEGDDGMLTHAVPVPDGQPEVVAEPSAAAGREKTGDDRASWTFSCPVSVPPSGTRRVLLRYAEPLHWGDAGTRYHHLPRFAAGSLPGLTIDFQLMRTACPLPFETRAGRVEFFLEGGAYVGRLELAASMIGDDLRLCFPPSASIAGIEENEGVYYAATSWRVPEPPAGELPVSETLGLVWDASASMRGCGHARALAFLREYLKRTQGKTTRVRLVVLRHEVETVREFAVAEGKSLELENFLKSLAYDGATGDLREAVAVLRPVGLCFVYSDGKGTLGEISPENPGVPAYALMPGDAGPTPSLARISAVPVALSEGTSATQVESLCRPPYRIRSLAIDGRDWPDAAASTETGGASWSVIGTVTEGKHFVEAVLTSGEHVLVLEQEIHTENAVPGDMLKARYAYLLARQMELQPDVLARRRAQKAIRELYGAAVPGYHWGLPVEKEKPPLQRTPEEIAGLASELREWQERSFCPRAFGARLKRFWSRAAEAAVEASAQREGEVQGEIATGKMPAWLRDDESGSPPVPRGKKKRRASAQERAQGEIRRKVSLMSWKEEASYLDNLKKAKDPRRVYHELCARHARCPGFFIDCSYFFSQRGDHDMAVRVISNLAEIDPDYLPLQMTLAMRLIQLDEWERARACLMHVLARQEDAVQVYWLLAYLEGKRGSREQAAEYLVRLAHAPGAPDGLVQNALFELNRLEALARREGRPLRAGLVDPAWRFSAEADLHVVLLWDAFDSDIDLEIVDPAGETCDSEKDTTASGGLRSRDIKLGLGAESFTVRRVMPGDYELSVSVFGPRGAPVFAPIQLCLMTSLDYGRSGERSTLGFFQMERRSGGAQLGRVRYGVTVPTPREGEEERATLNGQAGPTLQAASCEQARPK